MQASALSDLAGPPSVYCLTRGRNLLPSESLSYNQADEGFKILGVRSIEFVQKGCKLELQFLPSRSSIKLKVIWYI
jgi:hypothetical protein